MIFDTRHAIIRLRRKLNNKTIHGEVFFLVKTLSPLCFPYGSSKVCVAAKEFSVFRTRCSGTASFFWPTVLERNTMKKSCAILTEPPLCFPWGYDEEDESCAALKLLLLQRLSYLQTQGVTTFFVPLDDGIGLYAAELVSSLGRTNPGLSLTCCLPYEEQATKWHPDLRDRYFNTLAACADTVLSSREETPTGYLDAMLDAADHAALVLAVSAETRSQDVSFAAALRYAQRIGRTVERILPPKL